MEDVSKSDREAAERMARIAARAEALAAARQKERANGGIKFLTKSERNALRQQQEAGAQLPSDPMSGEKVEKDSKRRKKNKHKKQKQMKNNSTRGKDEEMMKAIEKGNEEGRRNMKRKVDFHWNQADDTFAEDDYLYQELEKPKMDPLDPFKRSGNRKGKETMHWSEKPLNEMSDRDWRIMREDYQIHVKGNCIPYPCRNWDELALPRELRETISRVDYKNPSPIQMQAIPIGLKQHDIIGVAETGSGKTAAFIIPLAVYLLKQPESRLKSCSEDGPLAVIMAPTRELAEQIGKEASKLMSNLSFEVRTTVVVGGVAVQAQINELRKGSHVVVATPGRLIDCLEHRYVVFNQCNYLVLDEADTMIDMGFEPQVDAVLRSMQCTQKADNEEEVVRQEKLASEGKALVRVTIMFTATMPPEVEKLAQRYMRFPAIVRIGDSETGKNRNIKQEVYLCPSEEAKPNKLVQLAKTTAPPIIVFVNSKIACEDVAKILFQNRFRCTTLHSGKSQDLRETSLDGFKSGKYDILVATDVAGRGLDIANVTHVINYEMAKEIDRYSHRIGRTGRAGKTGLASTLLTEKDKPVLEALIKYLRSTNSNVPKEIEKLVKIENIK